jgi:hypothetical protein
MLELWNVLKGKKTYLLSASCIGILLLKALGDYAKGEPIDMSALVQQILMCLATMALRHGIATEK